MSSFHIFTLLLVMCLSSYVYGKPSEYTIQGVKPLTKDETPITLKQFSKTQQPIKDEFTQISKQHPEIKVATDLIKAVAICQIIWAEERGQKQTISQEVRNVVETLKSARTCEFIKQEGSKFEETKCEKICKNICKTYYKNI